MAAFFTYIIQSSVCLIFFYLFFKIWLSKETWHRLNRISLLSAYLLALLLPLAKIGFPEGSEIHTSPGWENIAGLPFQTASLHIDKIPGQTDMPWMNWIIVLYYAGVLFFLFRLSYSLIRLATLIKRSPLQQQHDGSKLIIHKEELAPFSWLHYIIISEKDLEENGRPILLHESAHIRYHHFIDLFLSESFILFFWFNPASWLLKKELQQIHEYQADESVIDSGIDAKTYQLLLIKKAVGSQRFNSMTNSFNHSKLKTRITMMLKEKSKPLGRLKYLCVIPLAALSMAVFAHPDVSFVMEEISSVKVNDFYLFSTRDSLKVTSEKKSDHPHFFLRMTEASFISKRNNKESNPQFYLDGKKIDLEEFQKLDTKDIQSLTILKDSTSIKLYGEEGKHGVVLIETSGAGEVIHKPSTVLNLSNKAIFEKDSLAKVAHGEEMLFYIEGKKVPYDKVLELKHEMIKSIMIVKDKDEMKKYDQEAKNGLILIELIKEE